MGDRGRASRRRSSRTATTSCARSSATGAAGSRKWLEAPLEPLGNDRWPGSFEPTRLGRWQYTIEAWVDRYATLLDELDRKLAAGQDDLAGELAEAEAALRRRRARRRWHAAAPAARRARTGTARRRSTSPLEVDVERERARFGAWYELFPRSLGRLQGRREGAAPARRARLRRRLPAADPSDRRRRTGRVATTRSTAAKGDPGSPWAIGGAEGGHDAIHPELGTLDDFDALVARGARSTGSRSRSTSRSSARPTTRG